MDRRYELAIDEKFERLVRESPRPRLINGSLPVECDIYEDQERQPIIRPVPVSLVRNRANSLVSPLPRPLISPHPQYTNTGHSTNLANANESIEEIFEYIKQKSFESSREDSYNNVSSAYENDQSENYGMSKDALVGTGDVSDSDSEDIDTIECSFSAVPAPGDKTHADNSHNTHDKNVSSTVYNSYDEVDMCDTGYGASNVRDIDFSALEDEPVMNLRNLRDDSIGNVPIEHFEKNKDRVHLSDNRLQHNDRASNEQFHENYTDTAREERIDPRQQVREENDQHLNTVDDQLLDEIECREVEEGEDQSRHEDSAVEQSIGQEKEACSLYMWIIKAIPGSQCICVEGKKHPDEDQFWKSGMITKRLDAATVLTQSGSVYKLMGDIEFADAVYAGFSKETVAAFKHGFPEDWADIIDDHFNNSLLDRPDVEETHLISSTNSEPPPVTTKQTTLTSKGKNQDYSLSKWVPKPLGKGICVVGVNQDGMLWHSSAIEKRLKNKRLVTSSGSVCTLKGHMDKLQAKEENVPDAIITKFHAGFPKEWQELVQEYFTPDWFKVNEKAKKEKTAAKLGKDSDRNKATPKHEVRHQQAKTDEKKNNSSVNKRKSQLKSKDSTNKTAPARLNASADSVLTDTSVASESSLDQTVMTPAGSFVNLCNLKRSRSGRLLRPPLHPWMGINYDVTENGVTIRGTDYAKTVLKELEDQRKNASDRILIRYKYAKLDTTKLSVSSLSSTSSKSSNVSLPAGSSKKKTPANSGKKTDGTAATKSSKKDLKSSAAAPSTSTSRNKPVLVASSSKSKISDSEKKSKISNTSKKNSTQKAREKSSEKNLVKKIVITKSNSTQNGPEPGPSNLKKLKIQQAPAKDSDPKLDEEVFVMLKEMKENYLRNKSPGRTTCYDSVEKVSRTRGKRLDNTKDSYILDESGESLNATKHGNESSDTVREVNEQSSAKEDTDKSVLASYVSVPLKDQCGKGQKTKAKINACEKARNAYSTRQQRNENKNKSSEIVQGASKGRNRSKRLGFREITSLVPDTVNKSSEEVNSACYSTPSRVLRSKLTRSRRVDYNEYFQDNTPKIQNDKKKGMKLSAIPEVSENVHKTKTEETKAVNSKKQEAKDSNTKKQINNKKTKVNRAKEKQKSKSSDIGNGETNTSQKVEYSKDTGGEKGERGDKETDSIEQESQEKKASEKKASAKKSKSQQNTKEKPKEVAITAKAGTLKRKVQLKAFLEKQNENYEDDIFDSTPFRKCKKRKRPIIDDVDDDELFEELAKKQGKSRFETPAGGMEMRSRTGRTLKLASARKTPACYNKEDLLGSTVKNLDGYVHNLKKRQMLRAHRKLKNQTPKPPKKTAVGDDSPQKKLFQEFLQADKDDTDNHQDSDNEEDYYWDEETA